MTTARHDVCVVGAGPAGATLSYLLARRGWKVLLLEAGPRFDPSQRFERAADWVRLNLQPWASNLPARDRFTTKGPVRYNLNAARVFGVGGTTLHWAGLANRLHKDDFAQRTRYGVAVDWPITYDELEPFYVKAERLIGVSGAESPFRSPRSAPFPMPAFPFGHSDRYWQEVCERVGVSFEHTPWAKNSVPYDGRPECHAFGTCLPICPFGARYSADHHVAKAVETGNVTLLTERCVRRLLVDGDGTRITGVLAAGLDGATETHQADAYVVAAHAVESARLLLLSAAPPYPEGLGNRGDQVGRNLMEHWYVYGEALLKTRRFYPYRIGFSMADSHQFYSRPDRDTAGAYKLEFMDRTVTPLAIARRSQLWGRELAERIEKEFGRSLGIQALTEQLPYPQSRITLHRSEVNAFGDPIPVVQFHVSDYERETRRRAAETIRMILEATEIETLTRLRPESPGSANHHLGTCRMGSDPATSVVDPNLRIHGLRNAFVVSSGVFPSGGAAQPTLTIVALAVRLAEHLIAGRGAARGGVTRGQSRSAAPGESGLLLPPGVDLLHLFFAPGDGLVGGHLPGRVLREHVRDDVEVPHLLGRRGGRTRPRGRHGDLGDLGNEPVLLVALVDGVLGQGRQERHVEAMPRLHPPGLVLRLEVIAQEVLGEVDVLREVPDPHAPEACRRLAIHRTLRGVDVVDHRRDFRLRARDRAPCPSWPTRRR